MKTLINVCLLVLFISFVIYGCIPRGAIQGTVTDSNGDPVKGAKITTSPGGYKASSDSEGWYVIEDVEVGEYTVTASSGGLVDSTLVRMAGGMLNCQGTKYDFVISTSGWTTLTSPLSGTYSEAGYIFTKENSMYDVTGEVYFYETNVEIEDDVVIRFVSENSMIFGENTNITFGENIEFIEKDSDMMMRKVVIEEGAKVTINKVSYDLENNFEIKRDVDITNCDFSGVEIHGTGTIEYSDIEILWVEDSGSADVTRCNIKEIDLDNYFLQITSSNLTGLTTGQFKNNTPNNIIARYNYWYVNDWASIQARIDNTAAGSVTFDPWLPSLFAPAGPQ